MIEKKSAEDNFSIFGQTCAARIFVRGAPLKKFITPAVQYSFKVVGLRTNVSTVHTFSLTLRYIVRTYVPKLVVPGYAQIPENA